MSSSKEYSQIGKVSKELGISTRTIRYYEEIGLMGECQRVAGGTRYYSKKEVLRLKFILKLKNLGISLKEMKEISVNYELNNQETYKILPQTMEILETHLKTIEVKIKNLMGLSKDIKDYQERITVFLQKADLE